MLNNIKSKYILGIIFGNLSKRIELKLIKYNKILINKLNITQKDFENLYYKLLNEMNKKFKLDIKDIEVKVINLKNDYLGNEILEHLKNIYLKELKELNLFGNNISDIKVLEKFKFNKLEKLDIGSNEISDINILENVNFKELKELHLYYNNISDIKVLEKVKFEKLEKLNLSFNPISDINILEKVNFKELKELNLFGNNISDIKVLEKVKFEKLEILYLGNNKISKSDKNSIKQKLKIKNLYI